MVFPNTLRSNFYRSSNLARIQNLLTKLVQSGFTSLGNKTSKLPANYAIGYAPCLYKGKYISKGPWI